MDGASADLTLEPLEAVNERLGSASAAERIAWARREFGAGLVMSTSFGAQSAVLLHLTQTHAPGTAVVFIDTGYLFPETYRFAAELEERLGLTLHVYNPRVTPARQEALHGKRWEQGAEALAAYNFDNKVEPMNRAMTELGAAAWMSGLRRSQARSRSSLPIVQRQNKTVKVHPIVDWTDRDIFHYLQENDLPYHPLWEKGYISIGDWHSTQPLAPGMNEEETRFNGIKRECGLHEASGQIDFQI